MTTTILQDIISCHHGEIINALERDLGFNEATGRKLLVELQRGKVDLTESMRSRYNLKAAQILNIIAGSDTTIIIATETELNTALTARGFAYLISDLHAMDFVEEQKIDATDIIMVISSEIDLMSAEHPYERQIYVSPDNKRVIIISSDLNVIGPPLLESEEIPKDSSTLKSKIVVTPSTETSGESSASSTSTPPGSSKTSGTGFRRLVPSFPKESDDSVFSAIGIDAVSLKNLNRILMEINGQDAYNVEKAIVGKLERSEYLVLPTSFRTKVQDQKTVGMKCHPMPASEFIKIAALNHAQLGGTNESKIIGIMRAFMVEHGFYNISSDGRQMHVSHNEIVFEKKAPPRKFIEEIAHFMSDTTNMDLLYNLQTLAVLAPIMANEVFLKTGHHWLDNASYKEMYDRLFKACVLMNLKDIIPYTKLFHTAIHWVGPYTMRLAWTNTMRIYTLPPALAIRYNSAPAGCAIITTTKAILDAMKSLPFYKELVALYDEAIKSIVDMDAKIRKNPAVYFELPKLFGLPPLGDTEKKAVEESKNHAISLSAICQAFIDTIGKATDLAQAQALVKHAQQNAGIRKVMVNWFRDSFKTMGKGKTLTEVLTIATVKVRTEDLE